MPKQTWKTLAPQLRLVWQLSLPAILTQITTIAMQYIDSAMVGALGADASAAILSDDLMRCAAMSFVARTASSVVSAPPQIAATLSSNASTQARP